MAWKMKKPFGVFERRNDDNNVTNEFLDQFDTVDAADSFLKNRCEELQKASQKAQESNLSDSSASFERRYELWECTKGYDNSVVLSLQSRKFSIRTKL